MDNRILHDRETISEIHSSFITDKDTKSKSLDGSADYTESSSPRILKLKLLIKQSKSKFKLGLDFSFNYLKSLKKINWDEEAPDYREISDGVCLICYCKNNLCGIYNQMFVHNIGIGKFEIISEISNIYCEKCCGNDIDVRNIGFVNCEWIYKGLLKQKESKVSGEGKTMDKKLHTFKEVNISNLFDKLYINVNEVDVKSDPSYEEYKIQDNLVDKKDEMNKVIIEEILNGSKSDEISCKSKCLII